MEPEFELFVSSVEGKPVTRYGTGSRAAGMPVSLIGADRDFNDPTKVIYRTDEIVGLTVEEVTRYRREYNRQIADGALRLRTRAEWDAQQKAEREATRKAELDAKRAEQAAKLAERTGARTHEEHPDSSRK